MKPFFNVLMNDYVIDSVCQCGHLERDHGSINHKLKDNILTRIDDGGTCCVENCKCLHFCWKKWLTLEGFIDNFNSSQEVRLRNFNSRNV